MDLHNPSSWRITELELLDALARLLREGLVALDWTGFDADRDATPRLAVTERGRQVLTTTPTMIRDLDHPGDADLEPSQRRVG